MLWASTISIPCQGERTSQLKKGKPFIHLSRNMELPYHQEGLIFGYGISTVAAVSKKRKQFEATEDALQSGKLQISIPRNDSVILRMSTLHLSLSVFYVRKPIGTYQGLDVSMSIVKRCLRSSALYERCPLRKPSLSRGRGRLNFGLRGSV